jgi:putative tryptophan/tyrosine transport system substrate-binding protein
MRRREFLALALLVGGWPLTTHAQQPPALPVVGFLSGRSPIEAAYAVAAFRQGLGESGYVEGRDVRIEYRWADGQYERLPALAAELAARRVNVIAATGGSVAGLAAKAATATIPVVFTSGSDPLQIGLVDSMNRPGGNVTGVSFLFGDLGPKRLSLLRELLPQAAVIGLLVNPNYPSALPETRDVQASAKVLGLKVNTLNASAESDFEPAFAAVVAQRMDGLMVGDDPFLQSRRDKLVQLAARHAVPTLYYVRDFVATGGLMSYGPDPADGYRLAGLYTGRILKGEKPANLPVLQPTKFELAINMKTAKALGVTIPPTLLARADEVIE